MPRSDSFIDKKLHQLVLRASDGDINNFDISFSHPVDSGKHGGQADNIALISVLKYPCGIEASPGE